jgi:hypothetical protein
MHTQTNKATRSASAIKGRWLFPQFPGLAGLSLFCFLLACSAGCNKKRAEPRISGSRSDPAVSLQCSWKPGLRYLVRLEMNQLTDPDTSDPDKRQHRVTFSQESQIDVTSARQSTNLSAEVTILSLAMERAKGETVVVSFDSDQGVEAITEENHYNAILRNLVGGKIKFLITPEGKILSAQGLPQWLNKAFASDPKPAVAPGAAARNAKGNTNAVPNTNGPPNAVRKANNNMAAAPKDKRTTVVSAIRNYFDQAHFAQIFEFSHLPPDPVRVGAEWTSRGVTPISSRPSAQYETKDKFVGWQMNSHTNCARINIDGQLFPAGTPASAIKKGTLTGSIWINQPLAFPMTTSFEKQVSFPDTAAARRTGTNTIATAGAPHKSVHQTVTISLLDLTPLEEPKAAAADVTNKPEAEAVPPKAQ